VARGAQSLAGSGPPGPASPRSEMNLYFGALGEMPTVAGAPDALAYLAGAGARAAPADAVWSSREAAADGFVFAGSRWRGWVVRTLALVIVAAALTWGITLGLGVWSSPTTLPAPTVEGHGLQR
jgi:hypothetical protein